MSIQSTASPGIFHRLFTSSNSPTAATPFGIGVERGEESVVKESNKQRKAWSFLTSGIPALIEAFSVFCEGITHREKEGIPLRVRFKWQHIPPEELPRYVRFQKVNESSVVSINEEERGKAFQIIRKTLGEAQTEADTAIAQEKIRPIVELLERCKDKKTTRATFQAQDWKTLDMIDFELAQEFFENLVSVCNSNWMKSSTLKDVMESEYGIDYYEALIAEHLSLNLAYIEGLEGKQISLPILDEATGCYRSAVYRIRHFTLGDSLPSYILESDDPKAHPWFVVRGTQTFTGLTSDGQELRTGSLESILADSLDHECISRNVINKALVHRPIMEVDGTLVQQESLSDIFRGWHQKGVKVNLCGHSLGGTLVNALAVEFYDQVKDAYSFSGAGVSKEMAKRWDKLRADDPLGSQEHKLINFDYEGDFIPSGGRRLIGSHFAMTSMEPGRNHSLYDKHVCSHLNRDFQIQKVNLVRENHKPSRFFMERVRVIVGKCFSILLRLFSKKYVPDWWRRNQFYLEQAAIERQLRLENEDCLHAS